MKWANDMCYGKGIENKGGIQTKEGGDEEEETRTDTEARGRLNGSLVIYVSLSVLILRRCLFT